MTPQQQLIEDLAYRQEVRSWLIASGQPYDRKVQRDDMDIALALLAPLRKARSREEKCAERKRRKGGRA